MSSALPVLSGFYWKKWVYTVNMYLKYLSGDLFFSLKLFNLISTHTAHTLTCLFTNSPPPKNLTS